MALRPVGLIFFYLRYYQLLSHAHYSLVQVMDLNGSRRTEDDDGRVMSQSLHILFCFQFHRFQKRVVRRILEKGVRTMQ